MYARITSAQAKPGGVDEALRIWDGRVMPQLTQQRDYKGHQTCVNRDSNTMLTLTYWETREDADRTLNSDWMRRILGLFADTFAAPPPPAPCRCAPTLDLPAGDQETWARLSDPAALDAYLDDPDFYGCEGNFLTVGTVPETGQVG